MKSEQEKYKEQKRVDAVVDTIKTEENVIRTEIATQNALNRQHLEQNSEIKIKISSDESAWETSGYLRQQEQALMIDSQLLVQKKNRQKTLEKMVTAPYFGRIDFKDKWSETAEATQVIYLGIGSLKNKEDYLIYDWRAPIATLYYEGTIGQSDYETADGKQEVSLLLKRQFIIEAGKIQTMADTSATIGDNVLLEVLSGEADTHMKPIVSTIQEEQNKIIRDIVHPVIFIQGVAGSGKTSVLLQRIAFLLYHFRQHLNADEILLFSPNHLFSEYISNVLPSLGEENIQRLSFSEYLKADLPTLKIQKNQVELSPFPAIKQFKEDFQLIELLREYEISLQEKGLQFRPISLNGEVLLTKKLLRGLFRQTDRRLPLLNRLEGTKQLLLNWIDRQKEIDLKSEWVEQEVELLSEKVLGQAEKDHQENDFYSSDKIKAELARGLVEKRYRPLIKKIQRFGFIHFKRQYLHFMTKIPELVDLSAQSFSTEEWKHSIADLRVAFQNKKIPAEDAPLYVLLKKNLTGGKAKKNYRYIFIDEIQDYSAVQLALIVELYPTAKITLSGDYNQNIYGKNLLIAQLTMIFKRTAQHYLLKTSYRSTKEITEFNGALLGENFAQISYGRKGPKPQIMVENSTVLKKWLVNNLENNPRKCIITAKTFAECQRLYDYLREKITLQFISDEDVRIHQDILIVPADYIKGLEFDEVIVWVGETIADSSKVDQHILYTMCSRAMHKLTVLSCQKKSFITKIPQNLIEIIKAN